MGLFGNILGGGVGAMFGGPAGLATGAAIGGNQNASNSEIGGAVMGAPFGPLGAIMGSQINKKAPGAQYNPDYSGVGQYPGMISPLDNSGALQDRFKIAGPEKYGSALQNQITWQQMQNQNQAVGGAAQGAANARSQLATHGGLDSGASERLAQQGALNQMQAMQKAGAGAAGSRLEAATDVQNKKMGIDQANLANTFNAQQAANKYNIDKINSDRQLWAAQQMAQATADAAPKPKSFLGSTPIIGGMFDSLGI